MTRMTWVLALLLGLVAGAASAMPEGRFASTDGAAAVTLQRVADGAIRVEIRIEPFGEPLTASLVPRPGGLVYEEPAARVGWMDRLMSRRADRLPFDGRRLTWATRVDGSLVVTTLQVDQGGRPDLRRAHLATTDDGRLRVELWRYVDMEAVAASPVVLERAS